MIKKNNHADSIIVAYDGDCPFCNSYIKLSHLRANVIQCDLINLRDHPDMADDLKNRGFDPNEGLYVRYNNNEYHGYEAMTVITSLADQNKIINSFFKWMFSNKKRAQIIYPVLRAGRNLTLKLLGRRAF